jgi:hypothetical protein
MISAIISPQAEFEETVIKATQNLCEEPNREMHNLKTSIEAMRRELRTQLAEVDSQEWRRSWRSPATCAWRTAQRSPNRIGRPVCWRCGVIGHIRLDCPRGCWRRRSAEAREENMADERQVSSSSLP